MPSGRWVILAAAALAACGGRHQASALPEPDPARADGALDWFGPGIVERRRDDAELIFELRRAAHVQVMRLDASGMLTVLRADSMGAGRHRLDVPRQRVSRAQQVQPAGQPTASDEAAAALEAEREFERCRAAEAAVPRERRSSAMSSCVRIVRAPQRRGAVSVTRTETVPDVVIVMVSDIALAPGDFERRMRAVRVFDLETLAHDLPEYLIGDRTAMWAGYVVHR